MSDCRHENKDVVYNVNEEYQCEICKIFKRRITMNKIVCTDCHQYITAIKGKIVELREFPICKPCYTMYFKDELTTFIHL